MRSYMYVCGEFKCHLGICMNGFDDVHGNQGLKTCNNEAFVS